MSIDRLTAFAAALACGLAGMGGAGALAPEAAPPGIAPPGDRAAFRADAPSFLIGPIAGLTEGWHLAPKGTAIPIGTRLMLEARVPGDASVRWTGAVETKRTAAASTAVCTLTTPGRTSVQVTARLGEEMFTDRITLDVLDIALHEIAVGEVIVATGDFAFDAYAGEGDLNERTMQAYFGTSIAPLREIAPGRYLTSVERPVHTALSVTPAAIAPLIEWRIDGVPRHLGAAASPMLREKGVHQVSIGPAISPTLIEVETYEVTITSPDPEVLIPEGEPVVFTAITDPPRYQREIRWLASTKFGTALPVVGAGPVFVCEFNDTFGTAPDGAAWQWMGVRASSATAGQDQKCETIFAVTGISFEPGSEPFTWNIFVDTEIGTILDSFSDVMDMQLCINGSPVLTGICTSTFVAGAACPVAPPCGGALCGTWTYVWPIATRTVNGFCVQNHFRGIPLNSCSCVANILGQFFAADVPIQPGDLVKVLFDFPQDCFQEDNQMEVVFFP